jgi:hypothetical protein
MHYLGEISGLERGLAAVMLAMNRHAANKWYLIKEGNDEI